MTGQTDGQPNTSYFVAGGIINFSFHEHCENYFVRVENQHIQYNCSKTERPTSSQGITLTMIYTDLGVCTGRSHPFQPGDSPPYPDPYDSV